MQSGHEIPLFVANVSIKILVISTIGEICSSSKTSPRSLVEMTALMWLFAIYFMPFLKMDELPQRRKETELLKPLKLIPPP